MSNEQFISKASSLASRFDNEEEILEEAEEIYQSNQEDNV